MKEAAGRKELVLLCVSQVKGTAVATAFMAGGSDAEAEVAGT